MFSKNFVALAILSFVLTATAYGQKEIVVWSQAKAKASKQFTGSDEELGALIAWAKAPQKTNQKSAKPKAETQSRQTVKRPKTGSLIDTSTGEIVWADEVKATPQAKTPQRPKTGNLIDTSTGEIVWAKGNNPNSSYARKTPGATPKGISFNFDKMSQVQKGQVGNFSAGQDTRIDRQRTRQPRRQQKR